MPLKPGVYINTKKNGSISYRSSITFQNKHISLGSYDTELEAHHAYISARRLLQEENMTLEEVLRMDSPLNSNKRIVLFNFKTTGYYFKTPILLKDQYFLYFLEPEYVLKFDVDDLFYYSTHTITKRGGHLFVSDYGMQVNILSRYGIRNFAVVDRDYRFINGDQTDFRYKNIRVINKYYGVQKLIKNGLPFYQSIIHLNGNFKIGSYSTEVEAAIAYNKAVDILREKGINKNFFKNYILEVDEIAYSSLYNRTRISKKLRDL